MVEYGTKNGFHKNWINNFAKLRDCIAENYPEYSHWKGTCVHPSNVIYAAVNILKDKRG